MEIGILARVALGLVAIAVVAGASRASADGALREELAALGRRSYFFGHQSVGSNLIDGMQRLGAGSGGTLRIVEVKEASSVPPGTFAHGFVDRNGDPEEKLRSFARALGPGPGGPDVALFNLCYVDFSPTTDVQALFERYRTAIADLRASHPKTTFVHVTTPLTIIQGGPKAWVKRLLGKAPGGLEANARREAYNALLRGAYQGREPFVDLAVIESTRPDGSREVVEWNGRPVPALVAAYTDDGTHLNETGQDRAARELLRLLAALPGGAPAAAR
jgi:hypothetical protein